MVSVKNNGIKLSEEEALDRAITSIDPMLRTSLQREQKRRRRYYFAIGGVVMATIVCGTVLVFFLSGGFSDLVAQNREAKDRTIANAAQASRNVQRGWKLMQSGKLTEAQNKFSQAVKQDPGSADAWNGLGWSKFRQGDLQGSVTSFKSCIKEAPNHPAGLNGLGQSYLMLRKYDDAEKVFLKASAKAPAAWYGLFRVYLLTSRFEQAEKWGTKILAQERVPDRKTILQLMAAAKKGELSDKLRKEIEPAERIESESKEANQLAAQGWQFFSSGKNRPAQFAFEKALKIDPENASAWNGLGFALLNQGKGQQAKPYFEKLLKKVPDHAGGMNGLARCFHEEGNVEKAIKLWKKVDASSSQANAGTFGLANAYFDRKEFTKALKYYERIGESDSSDFVKQRIERCREKLEASQENSSG